MLEHKWRAKGIIKFSLVLCQQQEMIIIIMIKFAKEAIEVVFKYSILL